jgi:hypothetical protein
MLSVCIDFISSVLMVCVKMTFLKMVIISVSVDPPGSRMP